MARPKGSQKTPDPWPHAGLAMLAAAALWRARMERDDEALRFWRDWARRVDLAPEVRQATGLIPARRLG